MPDGKTQTGLDLLDDVACGIAYHVGIEVPDLDEARRFYVDLLGFEEDWIMRDLSGELIETLSGIPGAVETACLQLVVPGGSRIEIQQFQPQGTVGETKLNNQGLNHLSFGVKDVQAEYDRLTAAGVEFMAEPIALDLGEESPMTGWTVAYFQDPWGLSLELLGPTPGFGRA